MKKLKLNALAFNKGEVLSRTQLKNILGGSGSAGSGPCVGLEGDDLASCNYNSCMSGWEPGSHEQDDNDNKIAECCRISNFC